jgi:hypothetical protein
VPYYRKYAKKNINFGRQGKEKYLYNRIICEIVAAIIVIGFDIIINKIYIYRYRYGARKNGKRIWC